MESFLAHHQSAVKGSLSGFDRIRFRGTLRWIANVSGLGAFLSTTNVLLKNFASYATNLTDRIKESTEKIATQSGRPLRYLSSSTTRKEDVAREIAQQDQISAGLVCVLTAVEPCRTFTVGPNRQAQRLELRQHDGKCLHHYFYLIDSEFGWLNIRLQTWFPFNVHIVINGREWLAQSLVRKGIGFERRGNCFTDIANTQRAQLLMDKQLKMNWPRALNRLLLRVHPTHRTLFRPEDLSYYWSADETEWATDVMFRSAEDLSGIYPRLTRHAMLNFGSGEVLRFLGKAPHVKLFRAAEITSHLGTRAEGVRVKHTVNENSLKMYDKQESVLRVETTINNTRQMKTYRASEDKPQGKKSWQKLRKGVADLARRAEISQKANERYLTALAAVDTTTTLADLVQPVCQPVRWEGRSVRALQPMSEQDAQLLKAVSRGEFIMQGFRNRDLRALLFGTDASPADSKSQTAKVTRMIRMLRAHGIVHKVAKTHRYNVSPAGRQLISALLAAVSANAQKLSEIAA